MTSSRIPSVAAPEGEIPALGLGTWQLSGDACRQTVRTALGLGYRHVDTARMYENESEVGRGIADSGVPRDEIFLTTKLEREHLDPVGVRESCSKSLSLLDTDHVDLLLIHWPEDDVPLEDTLGAMGELRDEGLTRHVGVSNFPVDWMRRAQLASPAPIFCNQVEYHAMLDQSVVLGHCREHAIPLVAYCPLAQGALSHHEVLAEIGRRHDRTAAQVALRWLVRQEGVVAIPKSSGRDHLRQNLDVFDFELDADDLAAIDSLPGDERRIDPPWSPDWDFTAGSS